MSGPTIDSVVTFPAGSLTESAVVQLVARADGELGVVTDRTPFHPLDPTWPDQGPDLGTIGVDGRSAVCRSASAWKFSTATGTDRPLAAPNGPAPPMPGPPS